MTKRGLQASTEGIAKANQALIRNSLNKTALARDLGLSRATVTNFFRVIPIERLNFEEICQRLGLNWQEIVDIQVCKSQIEEHQNPTSKNSDFVGREDAIAHLDMLIDCDAKAIGIYGKGGIGKTTLAYHYFETQNLEYLELQVGIQAQYITSVKSWVKDQLRHQFKEEPQQDFISTLEQLKRKLQNKPVGIVIDNLETALDENGKFKKDQIDYLELFIRVLNAPNVKSITLITSRETINEAKLSFIEAYQLPELDESAWQKFFSRFDINVNCPAISEIHKSYGGNALCMKFLREHIQTKYNGDLETYWQDNKEYLLKGNIKHLVASQFDRIQDNNIY
ncbi:ATP-binding protein, partial [Nostoc sp. UCD122]|nr:ATP-binding protein [Nostoc sp. UCD122]